MRYVFSSNLFVFNATPSKSRSKMVQSCSVADGISLRMDEKPGSASTANPANPFAHYKLHRTGAFSSAYGGGHFVSC